MSSNKIGPNLPGALPDAAGQSIQSAMELKKGKGKAETGDYNVNFSGKAKEIGEAHAKALDIARSTPDVREDKVLELKKKIESGEYKVSSENIADGILREAVKDELSKGEPEL